jgi:hypothetical protein
LSSEDGKEGIECLRRGTRARWVGPKGREKGLREREETGQGREVREREAQVRGLGFVFIKTLSILFSNCFVNWF